MNRQRDLSSLMDDWDMSDTFVLLFPGKIHNSQSNQPKCHQIMNFLLGVHLSVPAEMAFGFSRHFALRKEFIAALLYVKLLKKRVTQEHAEKAECHGGVPIFLASYPHYESKESKTRPSSLREGWRWPFLLSSPGAQRKGLTICWYWRCCLSSRPRRAQL